MRKTQLLNFLRWLKENKKYTIIAPFRKDERILLGKIKKIKNIDLSSRLPLYSFKSFFLPPSHLLFKSEKSRVVEAFNIEKQVIFGMSIFDLKALNLWNHVFEKDPYYQKVLRKTLILGQSRFPKETPDFLKFEEKFEEDILEHLQFDIFFGKIEGKDSFKVFTGSEEGQKILEEFGFKDFTHVQFAGPIKEEGVEEIFKKIREKIISSLDKKFWEEVGRICLACGKCSLVCPTCFCFDIKDEFLEGGTVLRKRVWSSCFYSEFSEIAGGYKFLPDPKARIQNYYLHKFYRIPKEFGFFGCVLCGRCAEVCPAKINIFDLLKKIQNS